MEGREVNLNLDNVFKYTVFFLEITPKCLILMVHKTKMIYSVNIVQLDLKLNPKTGLNHPTPLHPTPPHHKLFYGFQAP